MESKRRPIDWVMVILAVMVVSSPAFAMAVADWADGLDKLWLIALIGLVVGLVISISRFQSLTAHGLNLVYGLAWIGFLLASPLPYPLWRDKILNLYARVAAWIALALRGGTGRDEMIFLLLLGLLFWWLGYTAIWNTVRYQRVWRALLPAGIVLLVNVYYYPGTKLTPYLMIYLLCALLVVVRSYTALQEGRWANEHIGYSSDVRFDLLRSGLALASAAILLAWVAPTAASSQFAYEMWLRVEGPWRRVEDDFNRMFSTLRSQSTVYGNPFGRTLTLRGPRNLTDTPVLDVYAPPEKRFYWRGVVYDRYTGSGWINTDSDALQLEAWREPKRIAFDAREEITQTITLFLPVNTLVFAAPEPQRIGLPVRADVRLTPPESTVEISQMISARSLMRGATYIAVSSLSTADIEKLRGAGTAYPTGIRERYLQLPASLPAFVRRQAQDIAGNLATPYDKAAAIEAWLRANIVYDDQTPAPPQDQDGAAYILTVKRGYCDYYASAMVIMLRSQGVPARVAVGYTQGKYDSVSSIYHVTEKDSHSWAEVYFPKYGWIEFEPTASQPVIDRPKPQILVATPTPDPNQESSGTPRPRPTRDREGPEDVDLAGGSYVPSQRPLDVWLALGIVGAFIALVFVATWMADRRKQKKVKRSRPSLQPLGRAGRLGRDGHRPGVCYTVGLGATRTAGTVRSDPSDRHLVGSGRPRRDSAPGRICGDASLRAARIERSQSCRSSLRAAVALFQLAARPMERQPHAARARRDLCHRRARGRRPDHADRRRLHPRAIQPGSRQQRGIGIGLARVESTIVAGGPAAARGLVPPPLARVPIVAGCFLAPDERTVQLVE